MKSEDAIRLFGLNNLLIESEIQRIERDLEFDLGHQSRKESVEENKYYPQFSERIRREAEDMARHYAVFYCLENYIRELIVDRLTDQYGGDWWNESVPEFVRTNAQKNLNKEKQTGVTLRSSELIDYSNFGELGEIIKSNWDIFGDMFRDAKAVERVLANLNTLRAPIAHCKQLAEDEVLRLDLALRDWFRQME